MTTTPKTVFDLEEFPALVLLTDELEKKYNDVFAYTMETIIQKPFGNLTRTPGMWDKDDADEFINTIPDEWINALVPDWHNYLLVFKKKQHTNDSKLMDILQPYIPMINMCGLSLLKPNAVIDPHIDASTTFELGRLAYHFNIVGKGSTITIGDQIFSQDPMNHLVFDSGHTHSVVNGSQVRVLLYIDFDVEMAKQDPDEWK